MCHVKSPVTMQHCHEKIPQVITLEDTWSQTIDKLNLHVLIHNIGVTFVSIRIPRDLTALKYSH